MITHSVRSMYVVCGNFSKLITVSTYIDVFKWNLDTMVPGKKARLVVREPLCF